MTDETVLMGFAFAFGTKSSGGEKCNTTGVQPLSLSWLWLSMNGQMLEKREPARMCHVRYVGAE